MQVPFATYDPTERHSTCSGRDKTNAKMESTDVQGGGHKEGVETMELHNRAGDMQRAACGARTGEEEGGVTEEEDCQSTKEEGGGEEDCPSSEEGYVVGEGGMTEDEGGMTEEEGGMEEGGMTESESIDMDLEPLPDTPIELSAEAQLDSIIDTIGCPVCLCRVASVLLRGCSHRLCKHCLGRITDDGHLKGKCPVCTNDIGEHVCDAFLEAVNTRLGTIGAPAPSKFVARPLTEREWSNLEDADLMAAVRLGWEYDLAEMGQQRHVILVRDPDLFANASWEALLAQHHPNTDPFPVGPGGFHSYQPRTHAVGRDLAGHIMGRDHASYNNPSDAEACAHGTDHASGNPDHASGNPDHASGNPDHASGNPDHASGNPDQAHSPGNLDAARNPSHSAHSLSDREIPAVDDHRTSEEAHETPSEIQHMVDYTRYWEDATLTHVDTQE
jgi:hypothetical protein